MATILRAQLQRKDTNYRKSIPVVVRVALSLYKVSHGSYLLYISEVFAVGKSTASTIILEFITAVNFELRSEISWRIGGRMFENMREFKELCGLPGIVGAIDGTHFSIRKPKLAPEDYYYYKSRGYLIQAQAVVNRQKKFLDVTMGMPGSTNDVRVLRRSSLYNLASTTNLFDSTYADEGFSPYLIGDNGYPLLPWLLTPYREFSGRGRTVEESLFNRKLRAGRCVVENSFGILKGVFRELRLPTELHVIVVPDLVIACYLLYNLLLGQQPNDVQPLLEMIEQEGVVVEEHDDVDFDIPPVGLANMDFERGEEKRIALGQYLSRRRNPA